jgi:hypothetical protein
MRRAAAEGGATATFSDSASATGSLRAGDGRFASGNIPAAYQGTVKNRLGGAVYADESRVFE